MVVGEAEAGKIENVCASEWKHDLSRKEVTRVAGVKCTEFVSSRPGKANAEFFHFCIPHRTFGCFWC